MQKSFIAAQKQASIRMATSLQLGSMAADATPFKYEIPLQSAYTMTLQSAYHLNRHMTDLIQTPKFDIMTLEDINIVHLKPLHRLLQPLCKACNQRSEIEPVDMVCIVCTPAPCTACTGA